jgi:DNA helicase II / ATP-dependent DNA helicase PcrA
MTREEFLDAWASHVGRFPNPEQLAIMDHTTGPLQITAGPGVGKTYALTLRICFLLCVHEVSPEAIVVTTFTRKAAAELRHRLQETLSRLSTRFAHLRAIDLSRMHLGTLHSLCWDILTQTPGSLFRHRQLLSALERAFFIRTTSSFGKDTLTSEQEEIQLAGWIDKREHRVRPSRWQWVKLFTTAYERLINDQIDHARFAAASPLHEKLIEYVKEYEAALHDRQFTDQTLLQQQALDLLCESSGAVWQQDITHVFVDEYQDFSVIGSC